MEKENINIITEEELTLVKKKLFEDIEIECYEDSQGNFLITRKQIGEALKYKDKNSFNNIFKRNKENIGESKVVKMTTVDGKIRQVETYTFRQLFQILRFSKQPLANAFMNWASLTLEQLITEKAKLEFKKSEDLFKYKQDSYKILEEYMKEINNKVDSMNDTVIYLKKENEYLKNEVKESKGLIQSMTNKQDLLNDYIDKFENHMSKINDTVIFKQYEKPTYRLESAILNHNVYNNYDTEYMYPNFYRDFSNWLGYELPKSDKVKTKQYILAKIDIDIVEMFVNGVISGRIIKSDKGNYIDLNGVFCNPIEFDKVVKHFNNKCAYCGSDDTALIEEHLIPKSNKDSADLIYNIIPACDSCNKSKYTEKASTWFKKQSFYTDEKLKMILNHYNKYLIK